MPFPEVDRVEYVKNPLEQVICQVKYPAVLRIETELPAKFQEDVREQYPIFEEKIPSVKDIPSGLFSLLPINPQQIHFEGQKSYKFLSIDKHDEITLSRSFVALQSDSYVSWVDFKEKLITSTSSLLKHYNPAFFSRIGLRYINLFKRSSLGFSKTTPWSELFHSRILGPLSEPAVSHNVENIDCSYDVSLSDDAGSARIILRTVFDGKDEEPCLLLDSDFFCSGQIAIDDYPRKLEELHNRAFRLLKWCIKDELHNALEPKE